jgi:hypothetical protein
MHADIVCAYRICILHMGTHSVLSCGSESAYVYVCDAHTTHIAMHTCVVCVSHTYTDALAGSFISELGCSKFSII